MTATGGPPGFVLGGVSSGVGKTVAALAVMTALENEGCTVQPAKAGPDFIDPSHHEALTGTPSRTLDPWLCGEDGLRRNYARGKGDICVIEGMMGLYDGTKASTADVAEILSLPVVLIVDASAGMESVAATALGFQQYAETINSAITVAGIIAQRAHGGRHEAGIRDALPDDLSYFGRIPPNDDLEIPDRHLGLEMGTESSLPTEALEQAAEALDVDALAALASTPELGEETDQIAAEADGPVDARIAVADDAAFCFRYPATIERFRERAELVTFSPLAGDSVPECDGVYLPGGYPELHAETLAGTDTLAELGELAAEGLPVFGECGGLMAMARTLTTADGETYEMAGILPADVMMHDRYQALDHVELEATHDSLTATAGTTIRGHEFHYSSAALADSVAGNDAQFAFETKRGKGIDGDHDGLMAHESLGTYMHIHPESGGFDHFLERVSQ